ncbi:RNA polymerase sigma factor [Sphingobacterium faecale]|uniref:RNA polymerase sigma factor n=1 Tax=Sphingobacterium faecale TaxID=2803775 RepID=A0ABS1R5H4_9SPHI|nr:RNA polymerase sigma factor [Sphingobacterium faecale]MBL1409252.1 RNA polymerase sigma factor [Sphingobacterium faecale]
MNALDVKKERELLVLMRDGDESAFEKLYFIYAQSITSHLLYLLKSSELVQEVLQDTFMAVWEYRDNIDLEQSFKSYLYKIATNKTYKLFRKAASDKRYRAYLCTVTEEGHYPIESYIYSKESQVLLNTLLNRMPAKQREVFTLFKVDGYSYAEISTKLGISHSTINTHINRANQFLKKEVLTNSQYIPFLIVFLDQYFS